MASTAAYLVLYVLLRAIMPAQAANVVSLLATAVANTAANRRLTFGISGRSGSARHQVKGLIAFGLGLALTSGALAALGPGAGRLAEVPVLIAANLAATVLRFLLYRHWVFGKHRVPGLPERAEVTAWPSPGPAIGTAEMATQGERSS